MIRIDPTAWRQIAARLNEANGNRPTVAAAIAAELHCSVQTVYKRAGENGYNSGKKKRSDTGTSQVPDSDIIMIAELISHSQRKNGKFTMTTRGAIELLARNGKIDPSKISVPNVNLRLRAMGLNKKRLNAPPPVTPLRSMHPNDVHQVDMSNCIQYYDSNGRVGIRTISTQFYKNKLHNYKALVNKKVFIRYALTDHWSGIIYFRYYYSAGENTADLLDFLHRCWGPKQEPGHSPFCGVPKQIMTDKGSAFRSAATQNMFKNFNIKWLTGGKDKNPRARGQVEKAHHMVELFFECNLKEQAALNIEQMNEWADSACREFNTVRIHGRHGHPRFPFWAANVKPHLQLPPENIETFKMCALSAKQTRTINAERVVSFDGRKYWVDHPEYLYADKINVRYSPFDYPSIIVENATRTGVQALSLSPLTFDYAGFRTDAVVIGDKKDHGKHARHTATQHAQKLLDQAREKIDADGELEAHKYEVPDVIQMQPHRNAKQINVDTPTPEHTIHQAKNIIMHRLADGPLTDNDLNTIHTTWADKKTVTLQEIEQMYETITNIETTEIEASA